MHPLTHKFFGPNGLQCLFAKNAEGDTAVGYVLRQIGSVRYVVTDGTVRKTCQLAQTAEGVVSTSHMSPGTMTFLLLFGGETEHVRHLSAKRCDTVEGHARAWHLAAPTATVGQIISGLGIIRLSGVDFDQAVAYSVTNDGEAAAGMYHFSSVDYAFRWNRTEGMMPMVGLGGYAQANTVSQDGHKFAGWSDSDDNHRHLVRWVLPPSPATEVTIHDLGFEDAGHQIYAVQGTVYGSDDGEFLAFTGAGFGSTTLPCLYNDDTGIQILPMPGDATFTQVGGISSDGGAVVGFTDPGGTPNLYIWTGAVTSPEIYAFGNVNGVFLMGTGISSDRSKVSGWTQDEGGGSHAFIFSQEDGFVLLDGLAEGRDSAAVCISDDGDVIGGWAIDADTVVWAVRWQLGVIQKLNEVPGTIASYLYGGGRTGRTFSGSDVVDVQQAAIWV